MRYRHIALLLALGLVLALVIPAVVLAQPRIPHTLEGRSACTTCHTVGGAGVGTPGGTGLPADHAGRADATCTTCHQAAAAAPAVQPTPTAAPKPAATPTPAVAKPAATPTAAPAKPAATPTAAALPKTGGIPVVPLALGGGAFLAALGWSLRWLLKR